MASISRHFELHELAEGAFAAIAIDGGHAVCNAGLIDLGGQIVVFDAFLTPQAALDLRQFSIGRFGRPPQIVIDSHYHNDHIWGNQVFADGAQIVSSTRTRELITTEGMEEFHWYSVNSAQRLDTYRVQYKNETDEQQREDALLWIGEYGGIVEALPNLTVIFPTVTFTCHLEIHGAKHTAKLTTFEGGHSGSDTVLYLPQGGIVFMGDLLFTAFHPWLGECDPLQLLLALREVVQLNAAWFVPGHGPVGTIHDVKLMIEYVEQCMETAQRLLHVGKATDNEIGNLTVPAAYQHWRMSQFYRTNIRSLCDRFATTQTG